jgi:hypothetical protein
MADVGRINKMKIVRNSPQGLYLTDRDDIDILLPAKYVTDKMMVDDIIEVFVYLDSDDRPVATTETPLAMVDDFAFLKVVHKTDIGAFLDWGLQKDLFVPYGEQQNPMVVDESYVVCVYEDNSGRIAASSKLDKFLNKWDGDFEVGQKVELLICEPTDLGFNAIIESEKWGLLYSNEIFQQIIRGQKIFAYIKKIRDDGKIDVILKQPGFSKNTDLQDTIVEYLKSNNGHSHLGDKSSPEDIYNTFGVSKKVYKSALGMLYKQKLIKIDNTGITLL